MIQRLKYNGVYKTIREEYKIIQFQKEYLISMMNNLSYLNNVGLYNDSDSLFTTIVDELKIIKKEFDKYRTIHVKKNNKDCSIKNMYNNIHTLLINYSNHITSNNINNIFKLFFNNTTKHGINKEKYDFMCRFIKPTSIWDSEYHKTPIPYIMKPDINKQKKVIAKELINSLLGIKNNNQELNIKSLINSFDNTGSIVIKSIDDLMETSNNFDYTECMNILGNSNLHITKNNRAVSLIENNQGVNIYIKYDKRIMVIQGLIMDDLLNIASSFIFVQSNIKTIKSILNYDITNIPKYFKDNYIRMQNLRDLIIINKLELIDDIKKKYADFKLLQQKQLVDLINEFLLSSKYRKIDILTLFLMSNEDDQKLAYILFDIFKIKDKKNIASEIYNSLHHSIRELLDMSSQVVQKEDHILANITENDIPYERRISMMKVSEDVKIKALDKLKLFKSNPQHDGKAQNWLDGLLKIPFGVYSENDILNFKDNFIKKLNNDKLFSDNDIDKYLSDNHNEKLSEEWTKYKTDKLKYLGDVRTKLDSAVYGHKDAKLQLERLFAQWINGESKGAILGLQGPPGTGKTSLAKNGLSKCLQDSSIGKTRPFAFLPIGGSVNSSTLVGHNFTYVGSTWGKIADVLITTKCMNPIIFIDEIDKVSQTEYGREIISILTHLTDSTQNDQFEDKYFAGIPLDLSKALIVFSFNDPSLIDPILRDRITIIETHPLSLNDKLVIINDYMLPEICREVGFNNHEIIMSNDIIKYIIETYTCEAGVRKVKEKIVEIIRDINLLRFHDSNIQVPYIVTQEYIMHLFENKHKMRVKKIMSEPMVGLVNGLYATTSGLGGLTIIQMTKFPSDKMLDIQLTGKPGDMMKESVQYALKVAWGLLTKKLQDKLMRDHKNKKSFGIHIHCPDAATPKDGPSAGAAFTLALYSLLTDKKINNKICITGEIDLLGNITAIGGIESKLFGGKRAGCTLGLIPMENWEDFEILKRSGQNPEDDTFSVKPISHIKELMKLALC